MTVRRYAVLDGEDVVNLILLDMADEYEPDEGTRLKLAPAICGPGWKYTNKKWIEPVPVREFSDDDDEYPIE